MFSMLSRKYMKLANQYTNKPPINHVVMFVVFANKRGFCLAFQVTFSPGAVLFREGDPPEDIYLLVEGEVSWRDCAKGKGWETETWKL